jgi:hypothetical protein
MSLIPAPQTSLAILEETVTVRVADLYDLLTRKGLMMTEPKARPAKRGYRTISMALPVKEYEYLSRLAEEQTRTPAQQALYLLRQRLQTDAIKDSVRGSGAWGEDANGLLPDDLPDTLPDEDDAVPEPLER